MQYSSYSDRHWAVVQVYCRHNSSSLPSSPAGRWRQWVVGRILEGAALEDKSCVPADAVKMEEYCQWIKV